MDYTEFLARQEEVYARFRTAQEALRQEGALPDTGTAGCKGGICIVLRPPAIVAEALSDLSARLAGALSMVQYPHESIHTTISDHGVADGRVVAVDNQTLVRMVTAVERMARENLEVLRACTIDLETPLVNRTSVIVPGVPNAAFLEIAKLLQGVCAGDGIELRLPWGAHSTIGRFNRSVATPDLAPLWPILESAPKLGQQRPIALEVRSFTCTADMFLMHTHYRIELH